MYHPLTNGTCRVFPMFIALLPEINFLMPSRVHLDFQKADRSRRAKNNVRPHHVSNTIWLWVRSLSPNRSSCDRIKRFPNSYLLQTLPSQRTLFDVLRA